MRPALRFAQRHESLPSHSGFYRDRIPLSAPEARQQYAFEVNLDLCSGCKACVTACHNLNGLDEDETWRSVGTLRTSSHESPLQHFVTTACHHCVDPGCLTGCPVNAYDKDPVTGIVRHLDDQCIGCQYCTLKCPYDVPKYSPRRGIVRKCDMCSSRLSAGEAPACVQGCPNEAIRIRVINTDDMLQRTRAGGLQLLPSAPDSKWTVPTTRYITERGFGEEGITKEAHNLSPAAAHMPLVIMLPLTQLSVGGFAALAALSATLSEIEQNKLLIASVVAAMAGLGASVFHLGRPHLAWRAVLNLRRSWMSREIALFGVFALVSTIHLVLRVDALVVPTKQISNLAGTFSWLTTVVGLVAIFSSVMIYHDTHRAFWNWRYTARRFFGTTALLGTALAILLVQEPAVVRAASFSLLLFATYKLAWEAVLLRSPRDQAHIRSATLMTGALRRFTVARFILGGIGGLACPMLLLNASHANTVSILAGAAFLFCLIGELLERFLFFTAVAPDRMPS